MLLGPPREKTMAPQSNEITSGDPAQPADRSEASPVVRESSPKVDVASHNSSNRSAPEHGEGASVVAAVASDQPATGGAHPSQDLSAQSSGSDEGPSGDDGA